MPSIKSPRDFEDLHQSANPDPWLVNPPMTLSEARQLPDAYVILWGEYGASIYMISAASALSCNQAELEDLLSRLDSEAWNDFKRAGIHYVPKAEAEASIKTHLVRLSNLDVWLAVSLLHMQSSVLTVLGTT